MENREIFQKTYDEIIRGVFKSIFTKGRNQGLSLAVHWTSKKTLDNGQMTTRQLEDPRLSASKSRCFGWVGKGAAHHWLPYGSVSHMHERTDAGMASVVLSQWQRAEKGPCSAFHK